MWERQRELATRRQGDEIGDQLLLLEHPHVYTNGRHGDPSHLLADSATLEQMGASYHRIDRGGDITYHGPGQLVGYPIVRLGGQGWGVRDYVRSLERAIIQTATHFGVSATTLPGFPGVWVGNDKLAAIGVKVSRGVAYHGFALNVVPDLRYFAHIIPCGLADRGVTSLAALLGAAPDLRDVSVVCAQAVAAELGEVLDWATLDAVTSRLEGLKPDENTYDTSTADSTGGSSDRG